MADEVKFAVVQGAMPTSTGTQTFTKTGFGTPVAAMFFMTNGTSNSTVVVDFSLGIGFTDGTSADDRSTSVYSDNAQAISRAHRSMRQGKCIHILEGSDPAVVNAEADFDAWVTDGVRIDWTTVSGTAHLVNCLLIGGTDVAANVVEANLGGTIGGETSVAHGLGETPVMAFFLGTTAATNGVSTSLSMSMGMITYQSSTISQRWLANYDFDSDSTADAASIFHESRCFGSISTAGISRAWECTTVDGTNVGLTNRGPNAFGGDVQMLAIGFGSATNEVELGTFNGATATGTVSYTNTNSWQPQFIMLAGTGNVAVDTNDITYNQGIGISIVDADAEYSVSARVRDTAGTMDTDCITSNTAVDWLFQGSTDILESLDGVINSGSGSIDSDGFTIDYTAALTSANKNVWLMVQENAASTTPFYYRRHIGFRYG